MLEIAPNYEFLSKKEKYKKHSLQQLMQKKISRKDRKEDRVENILSKIPKLEENFSVRATTLTGSFCLFEKLHCRFS